MLSPVSRPVSRIFRPSEPLTGRSPTQKKSEKGVPQPTCQWLYGHSTDGLWDGKHIPENDDFFIRDLSENSAYFQKSKHNFFVNVMIREKPCSSVPFRLKPDSRQWRTL